MDAIGRTNRDFSKGPVWHTKTSRWLVESGIPTARGCGNDCVANAKPCDCGPSNSQKSTTARGTKPRATSPWPRR